MGELTQYDYLKGSLLQHQSNIQKLTNDIKNYCQNVKFPLDKRWDLFIESGLGEHSYKFLLKSYDIPNLIQIYPYTYWNIEDIISLIYDNFIEDIYLLEDEIEFKNIPECELNAGSGINIDKLINNILDKIKEECLQLFIKSFDYG